MTKAQIYITNVKSALKLHKEGRWANKRSVYNWILWYSTKFVKTQII